MSGIYGDSFMYMSYHNEDRIHDALYKDAPNPRLVEDSPSPAAMITSTARLGGPSSLRLEPSCLKFLVDDCGLLS